MKLEDLKALQRQVKNAISSYEARKKAKVLAELEVIAKKHSFKLADLLSLASTLQKQSPAKVYRDPVSDKTWSGQGQRPGWFVKALESGMTREDLRIDPESSVVQFRAA